MLSSYIHLVKPPLFRIYYRIPMLKVKNLVYLLSWWNMYEIPDFAKQGFWFAFVWWSCNLRKWSLNRFVCTFTSECLLAVNRLINKKSTNASRNDLQETQKYLNGLLVYKLVAFNICWVENMIWLPQLSSPSSTHQIENFYM